MKKYRDQWKVLLENLHTREQSAQAMGGEKKIAAQHAKKKLTARERIDMLFDANTFNEVGALAGGNHPAGHTALAGDGLVGGTGRVLNRSVVAIAEDFTVKGGSIGHVNSAKRARLFRLASEQKMPLVIMLDGAGHRLESTGERHPSAPGDLQLAADIRGKVPVITMILGASAGHGALTGMFSDFIVMTKNATLFTAGPPLVSAALGVDVSAEQLGSAAMHTSESGVAHNLAEDEVSAFQQVKYVLSMLPQHAKGSSPTLPPPTKTVSGDSLLDIIPPEANTPYDVSQVLTAIADPQTVFQLQPGYGVSLVVAFARFNGVACLIVANQPTALAGAITRQAAEKAAHFMRVANNFGLPLITLLDNPGVMPGPDSERDGILKASAEMFLAQRQYRGKKIVITLRKAFGFGSSVMGMNPWDRQTISLALPCVNLGGVPAIGGAQAAKATEEEADFAKQQQSGPWVAADAMAFDKVIDPRDMREEIINALQ